MTQLMQKHVILRAQLGHGGMWTIYIKRGRENQFLERKILDSLALAAPGPRQALAAE